jgi:hypothetical protein
MIRVHIELLLAEEDLDRVASRIAALIEPTAQVIEHWLDVPGAAAHLGLTENGVRGLVKRHQLPVHRTENGRLRFSVTELDEWVRTGLARPATEDLP